VDLGRADFSPRAWQCLTMDASDGSSAGSFVDLSIPLAESIARWEVTFESVPSTFCHQASRITLPVHVGTHLDAPLHYIAGGASVDQFPLELAVCRAVVADLTHIDKNQAIDQADLEALGLEDIGEAILLRTDWDLRWWGTPAFWEDAPYLTGRAATWLTTRGVRIVGYDFPQEYAIRNIAKGKARLEDFVVHLELLGKGIWQLEYLANLHRLGTDRATLLICPLPLVGLEASPVRVLGVPCIRCGEIELDTETSHTNRTRGESSW